VRFTPAHACCPSCTEHLPGRITSCPVAKYSGHRPALATATFIFWGVASQRALVTGCSQLKRLCDSAVRFVIVSFPDPSALQPQWSVFPALKCRRVAAWAATEQSFAIGGNECDLGLDWTRDTRLEPSVRSGFCCCRPDILKLLLDRMC